MLELLISTTKMVGMSPMVPAMIQILMDRLILEKMMTITLGNPSAAPLGFSTEAPMTLRALGSEVAFLHRQVSGETAPPIQAFVERPAVVVADLAPAWKTQMPVDGPAEFSPPPGGANSSSATGAIEPGSTLPLPWSALRRADSNAPASPIRFGDESTDPKGPSPEIGEHTNEILEMLGFDAEARAKLHEAKIVKST